MSASIRPVTPGRREIGALQRAGAELLDVIEALQRKGRNVITELLPEGQRLQLWDHLPADDAFDVVKGYRWYYHAHPLAGGGDEHGHFHVFDAVRGGYTHLVAISVAPDGLPRRAFTTNRWVTNEVWAPAARVLRRMRGFTMQHPSGLALVHRWLAALFALFRPQLERLLGERDRRVAVALKTRPDLFEDRRTSLLSQCRLDVSRQFAWLESIRPGVAR